MENNENIIKDYRFSVAMSVYEKDNAEWFDRALESITIKQTLKPNEIVLVVDGTVAYDIDSVIDKYNRKFNIFKIIRLPQNKGLGNALKLAVENASFELIARMDSDDVSVPDRFEKQTEVFKNNNKLDIVGGDISEFIGEESNIIVYRRVPINHQDILQYLKQRCPFNHMSVMYKKSAVLKAGGYLDLFWNEDYYLWIRMCEHGAEMMNTGTVLVNVRVGSEMYQRRGGWAYFSSEYRLQKYMYQNQIIRINTFFMNSAKRFILQVMMPNRIRGWSFRKFAREKRGT